MSGYQTKPRTAIAALVLVGMVAWQTQESGIFLNSGCDAGIVQKVVFPIIGLAAALYMFDPRGRIHLLLESFLKIFKRL